MGYNVAEVFYGLQGEGARAGVPSVFVMFGDGDSNRNMNAADLAMEATSLCPKFHRSVVFAGTLPERQLDDRLVTAFRRQHFFVAVMTPGTRDLHGMGLDWITVSPCGPGQPFLAMQQCDEFLLELEEGEPIPRDPPILAKHYLASPAFASNGRLRRSVLDWVISQVKLNPSWRLSVQQHKLWYAHEAEG